MHKCNYYSTAAAQLPTLFSRHFWAPRSDMLQFLQVTIALAQ
jgi:hypothetical protein